MIFKQGLIFPDLNKIDKNLIPNWEGDNIVGKYMNKQTFPKPWKAHEGNPEWQYCHVCGNPDIAYEGPAEGFWCPNCGSSDSDE